MIALNFIVLLCCILLININGQWVFKTREPIASPTAHPLVILLLL